jgi:hypothetical protein
MKKIGFSFIIITWILIITATAKVIAEEKEYDVYMTQVPVICGTPDVIESYITDNEFVPINVSVGRQGAKSDGKIIFLITYYVNEESQTLATIDIPSNVERCIIFHTFDLKVNEQLLTGKGI